MTASQLPNASGSSLESSAPQERHRWHRSARRMMAVTLCGGLLFSLLTTTTTPAHAADKSTKPRSQVDDVPGQYIQLETLWMPIRNHNGSLNFLGLVVRLWPGTHDDQRYHACIDAPLITDALLVAFNKAPMSLATYRNDDQLHKAIADVVYKTADKKTITKVETMRDFVVPDQDSATLTLTCR